MIILGLDPGLATTGYGVIEHIGSKFKIIDYGIIHTPAKQEFTTRLLDISKQLQSLFQTHDIEEVAVEDLFFNANTKTAMSVAQARGVLLLTARQNGKNVFSYTPPQVKLGVCGYGRAEKKQIQYMVQKLLNLDKIPKPDDAADALGVALCHGQSRKLKRLSRTP